MAKLNSSDIYQAVTDRMLKLMKQGVAPWSAAWNNGTGSRIPANLRSKKQYRGINTVILWCEQQDRGFGSHYWLTYNQAKELGGSVRKGEQSTMICFWKRITITEEVDGKKERKRIPMLRYYRVFNADQCEGLEGKIPETVPNRDHNPVAAAEAIVESYEDRPEIVEGRPAYMPQVDKISMPKASRFSSAEHYYKTLFHELIHSTGAESRLGRPGIVDFDAFGSHQYSQEELVAEFGAAFLCAVAGIDNSDTDEQAAAYLKHWIEVIQADPKLVVKAAGLAQRAADYINGVTFEDDEVNSDERNAAETAASV